MRKLRRCRVAAEKRLGTGDNPIERINIRSLDGQQVKSISRFVYLGTLLRRDGSAKTEVSRRIVKASTTFISLGHIWNSASIGLALKYRLFNALVGSIMLYNSECWAMNDDETRMLDGFYFRCLRRISKKARGREGREDHASKVEVFEITQQPELKDVLRQKRLRWIWHVWRRKEEMPSRQCLVNEMETSSTFWNIIDKHLGELEIKHSWKEMVENDREKCR